MLNTSQPFLCVFYFALTLYEFFYIKTKEAEGLSPTASLSFFKFAFANYLTVVVSTLVVSTEAESAAESTATVSESAALD